MGICILSIIQENMKKNVLSLELKFWVLSPHLLIPSTFLPYMSHIIP